MKVMGKNNHCNTVYAPPRSTQIRQPNTKNGNLKIKPMIKLPGIRLKISNNWLAQHTSYTTSVMSSPVHCTHRSSTALQSVDASALSLDKSANCWCANTLLTPSLLSSNLSPGISVQVCDQASCRDCQSSCTMRHLRFVPRRRAIDVCRPRAASRPGYRQRETRARIDPRLSTLR